MQGIKDEATVTCCEPLYKAGGEVLSAFPQGKQNWIFPEFYISFITEI